MLDVKVFETCFRAWIGHLAGAVAIDGKTVGSRDGRNLAALHHQRLLGQEHTRGKGNEIPAIKAQARPTPRTSAAMAARRIVS